MTAPQRKRLVGLMLFMVGCFVLAGYYFHEAGTDLVPGSGGYTAQAIVPSAVALASSADVREYGVDVGKVDKLAGAGPDGRYTLIEFELDSHAPLYRNAQVYVRAKSVAGENYLELDPGTPAAGVLPSGGILGIDHAQDATQIDRIFSIFDHARQQDLRTALSGLDGALADGGGQSLSGTLEAASALPTQGENAAAVLANDGPQVADLVSTLGTVAGALGQRAAAIQQFTLDVAQTARAVSARDAKLKATLRALGPFLAQAQTSAGRLERFAHVATPVIANLRFASQDLVPAVHALLPAAREGKVAMRALDRFASAAEPALNQLRPFAGAAGGFVGPLAAFLQQARPMVTYLAPYFREVGSFFALDAASFQPTDSLGHVARIELPISQSDLGGVLTPQQQALIHQLDASFDSRGVNPYPAPGGAGAGAALTQSYPRVAADGPYTRSH